MNVMELACKTKGMRSETQRRKKERKKAYLSEIIYILDGLECGEVVDRRNKRFESNLRELGITC